MLSNKIGKPTHIDPTDFIVIWNNLDKVKLSYLSYATAQNKYLEIIWIFKGSPYHFNKPLVISLIIPLVDSTFDIHLYYLHIVPKVKILLHKTI